MQNNIEYKNTMNITPEDRPVSGQEYMCITAMDKEALYCIAVWKEEGDDITLSCEKDAIENWDKMTPAERILETLRIVTHKCEKSGFYEITGDYGLDEEKYPGCSTIPVYLGDEVWYAPLPKPPAGLLSHEEVEEMIGKKRVDWFEKRLKKELDMLRKMTEEGGVVETVLAPYPWMSGNWRNLILFKSEDGGSTWTAAGDRFEYNGVKYPVNEQLRDKVLLFSLYSVDKMMDLISDGRAYEMVRNCRDGQLFSLMEEVTGRGETYGVPEFIDYAEYISMFTKFFLVLASIDETTGIDENLKMKFVKDTCREVIESSRMYREEPASRKEIMAGELYQVIGRLKRICTLKKLSAPYIVLDHELRVLFEHMYALMAPPVFGQDPDAAEKKEK